MTDEQIAACQRLREKYRDRFRVTAETDGHLWGIMRDIQIGVDLEFCLFCAGVRRADRQNKPCRGPSPIVLRANQCGE